MTDAPALARQFESERPRLRAVAYRMLSSLSAAEDAVQEAWIRLSRISSDEIDNLPGWLTVVVSRICLDMIRSRDARREESVGVRLPDPIVTRADQPDPEHQVVLSDEVGLALQVVLQELRSSAPATLTDRTRQVTGPPTRRRQRSGQRSRGTRSRGGRR